MHIIKTVAYRAAVHARGTIARSAGPQRGVLTRPRGASPECTGNRQCHQQTQGRLAYPPQRYASCLAKTPAASWCLGNATCKMPS